MLKAHLDIGLGKLGIYSKFSAEMQIMMRLLIGHGLIISKILTFKEFMNQRNT